jgi:hypothetical protein
MRRLVVIATLALPVTALAGPSDYGWLPATELVPANHVELGGWIYERDDRGDVHERATVLGAAPTFGVSDRLELRLPFELMERSAVDAQPRFAFSRFGGEARYRFTPRIAELAPVARFALVRDAGIRSVIRSELGVALAFEQGLVHVEAAADLVAEVNRSSMHFELHPGAGASVAIHDALRLGGELYAEVSFDSVASTWLAIGPNLATRFGPSWLSATFGIGITGIEFAPRINWGLAW